MFRSYSLPALALLVTTSLLGSVFVDNVSAEDGLQEGDPLGVFHVTKVAGAVDDAVEVGETLCYRCRYGSRPMVLVFARDTGGKVPELLKAIDKSVGEHEESKLKGLLTLLGDDSATLKEDAGKIAAKADAKRIPVAVAKEHKTGPLNYRLSGDAEVTVVLAQDSQVVNAHTFDAEKIDIQSVISEVASMLN